MRIDGTGTVQFFTLNLLFVSYVSEQLTFMQGHTLQHLIKIKGLKLSLQQKEQKKDRTTTQTFHSRPFSNFFLLNIHLTSLP